MINWTSKAFEKLTSHELYEILRLRSEVFVVEQQCIFLDADHKDQKSFHLMGWKENLLSAYTRLVPPGISYQEMSIGRVVTSPLTRGSGIGRELMQQSILGCYSIFGKGPIRIGAQLYLKSFYSSLGFKQMRDIYLEDGIEHIEMLLP